MKLHVGMRKVKSLIALAVTFVIWQLIRIFLPMLEVHPVFAYIYSVIEIRETPEKTKKFGKLRIKATFIGLVVGLAFITLSLFITSKTDGEMWRILVDFLFVLLATLTSLVIAENTKCQNFCGIAAIITIICMVSHNEEDIYLYAIMRVIQTLIGVFSAMLVNVFIKKEKK
ncbi:MAG: FUSC family protein [Clostridia bacterium]|nr:FUSC family protein [Clostridia bacterium]